MRRETMEAKVPERVLFADAQQRRLEPTRLRIQESEAVTTVRGQTRAQESVLSTTEDRPMDRCSARNADREVVHAHARLTRCRQKWHFSITPAGLSRFESHPWSGLSSLAGTVGFFQLKNRAW